MRAFSCYLIIFLSVPYIISAQEYVDGCLVSSKRYEKDNSANSVINLYQKHLSKLKNGTCAMYPSCSNYGLMVFNDKPFFEAMSLMSDRLVRCSHDRRFYATTNLYGTKSLVDYPYYYPPSKDIYTARSIYTDVFKSSNDSLLLFINDLINRQQFDNALYEIQRKEFFSGLSERLAAKKLLCYRALGEYEKGLFEFEVIYPNNIRNSADVLYEGARLYYVTDNNEKVESLLNQNSDAFDSGDIRPNVLKAISYAKMGKYESSYNEFCGILTGDSILINKSLDIVGRLQKMRPKKPVVAKALSIIPGAGYLYAGHKGSALTSFLVNSLLMYATYTSVKRQNYGLAGVMGFVSISFYIGNINGSGRSVERYNTSVREKYIEELERINFIYNN